MTKNLHHVACGVNDIFAKKVDRSPKVGVYSADYSEPLAADWRRTDSDVEALFAESKVISEKSDS